VEASEATEQDPLEIGPLFDDVGRVFGERGLRFVALTAAVTLPAAAAKALSDSVGSDLVLPFLGGMALLQIVDFLARYLVTAALIHATARVLAGRKTDFATNLASGWSSLGRAAWTSIVVGFVTVLGFLFFIVPGIVLACALFVAIPAAVVEGKGAGDAMARSRLITQGHKLRIFVLMLLVGLGAGFIGGTAGLVGAFASETVGTMMEWLVNALFTPVWAVLTTVAYWRLRAAHDRQQAIRSMFG
jgi:hypothetical protein